LPHEGSHRPHQDQQAARKRGWSFFADANGPAVAEIEAEQALVAANRELITRFEQKIQATLARIWGETEPE
jgi:hypothetical protein